MQTQVETQVERLVVEHDVRIYRMAVCQEDLKKSQVVGVAWRLEATQFIMAELPSGVAVLNACMVAGEALTMRAVERLYHNSTVTELAAEIFNV